MKVFKGLLKTSFILLVFVAIIVSGLYVYYHFFVHDITIGTNYITDQNGLDIKPVDEMTEDEKSEYEERWFMEANYYSNDKNNGIELQELNMNYFTDYTLTSDTYRSIGMQFIGDFETYKRTVWDIEEGNEEMLDDFYYYDTANGISYNGESGNNGTIGSKLNRNNQFIIKIDNRAFAIQLTGTFRSHLFLWNYITGYYDWGDVFDSVLTAVKTNNQGYGDYYVTVDLTSYFSIREYDSETGKFKEDDVTDIIKNYAVLKFHYDENGARNSSQSLFEIIECNPSYDLQDDTINPEYWTQKVVYTLTPDHLGKRKSEVLGGTILSLTIDLREKFAKTSGTIVDIVIDLSKYDSIIGFDYDAFENFEINSLTILGSDQTIYFLDNSFNNSNLQTLKYSSGLDLEFADSAINSDYEEVKL